MDTDRDRQQRAEDRETRWIYHLAPRSELRAGTDATHYAPARLGQDGFVHCAGSRDVTLSVASDYFAPIEEPLCVLRIDPSRLQAPLRFEAPAPIAGGGRAHLAKADHFPHVYGPIDRAAIDGAAVLARGAQGFRWPDRFGPLEALLG